MAYTPRDWTNVPLNETPPDGAPALDAANLDRIESGISAVHSEIDGRLSESSLSGTIDAHLDDRVGPPLDTTVEVPADFTWQENPLAGRILTNGEGGFKTDFDVSVYAPPVTGTMYVSPTGSDTSDGLTPETPKRSARRVIADHPQVNRVILASGVYHREVAFAGVIIERDLSLIAAPDATVSMTTHSILTWTPTSGQSGVWQATRSQASAVWDSSRRTIAGDYTPLTAVATVDDVAAAPGSYLVDGSTVYVHTHDGREPDADIRVYLIIRGLEIANGATIYAEGINFEGGVEGAARVTDGATFLNRGCSFKYVHDSTSATGGLSVNASTCYSQEAVVARNPIDGFNYHSASRWVEVDCLARDNGSAASDQQSTSHGASLGVRFGGTYSNGVGANIADVNDGTEAWMLGVLAFGATDGANFQLSYGNYWLDHCRGFGANYSIASLSGAVVRLRMGDYLATTGPTVTY